MEIRRSYDRLISTMGFPILVRWHLYIESGPWVLHFILHCTPNDKSVVTICSMISILFEIIMYNDSNTYSTVYNEGIDLNRRVPFHQFCVWYEDCIKRINIVFPVRPITRRRKHFNKSIPYLLLPQLTRCPPISITWGPFHEGFWRHSSKISWITHDNQSQWMHIWRCMG